MLDALIQSLLYLLPGGTGQAFCQVMAVQINIFAVVISEIFAAVAAQESAAAVVQGQS
jgi:hypothetical protein